MEDCPPIRPPLHRAAHVRIYRLDQSSRTTITIEQEIRVGSTIASPTEQFRTCLNVQLCKINEVLSLADEVQFLECNPRHAYGREDGVHRSFGTR